MDLRKIPGELERHVLRGRKIKRSGLHLRTLSGYSSFFVIQKE